MPLAPLSSAPMVSYSLPLALVISNCALSVAQAAPPTVSITAGALRGAWTTGGDVAAFRDVPFALAKRFEPPQPAATWTGVRDAKYFVRAVAFDPSAQLWWPSRAAH